MSFYDNLTSLLEKYEELGNKLALGVADLGNDFKTVSKEYAKLTPIVELINKLRALETEYKNLDELIENETEVELKELAKEEHYLIKEQMITITKEIQVALLPPDLDDDKNIILEIRAGTGGDEAGLFAADLFRMYQKYAELQKWQIEIISSSETGVGGYKEIIAEIKGNGVFARFKFESGVHRVQRIPDTETNGRIHTSAATVAVLPEAEEVDIKIDDKDLKIDIYRASGAGGQHVNTTDSAVRITHLPTGIVVVQQDERSQHKNRAKAMKILMSRIYEQEKRELSLQRSSERKSQVGTGDRSERIRTYNFPQGRLSDHRINLTLYKLDKIMAGELDEMIDSLIVHDQAVKLAESHF